MALVDVIKCCIDSIKEISEHIEGAVLYLDSGCTESFQFVGAFPVLLDLGVRAVCSLENMSPLDAVADWNSNFDPMRKIVVMTSRLLSDTHRYILRCLSTNHGIRHCAIFTSISEIAHSAYPNSPLGPDAFREYETLLLQDYEELVQKRETESEQLEDSTVQQKSAFEDDGWSRLTSSEEDTSHLEASSSGKDIYSEDVGQALVVSVHHFPLILCPLSPRVFVLPSEGSVAEACLSVEHEDSLSPGLPSMTTGLFSDGDDVPSGATLTAHFIYHLAAKMDLKMEIFSLGDLSKSVGKILMDMSSLYDVGRRKRPAGLLLVDRTFDLLTPCCHGDSLIDRMFSSLTHRKRTASYTHMKGAQSQAKLGSPSVERPPVEVQVPLAKILSEEDSKINDSRLKENIEAFLRGWDAYNSSSQVLNLADLSNKVYNEKSLSSEIQLLTGSFVSTEHFRGTPYMEALLDRRTKDAAVLIKKWLQETLHRENLTVNVRSRPGSATKAELKPMIKALAENQSSLVRNRGIIQLAAAALATLDESHSARWDAFVRSHEQKNGKMESSSGLLSFKDALLLVIIGYILAGENFPTSGSGGPFSWQEEHFLKEAIVDAIIENPSEAKFKFLHGLTEELEANINRIKSEESKEVSPYQLEIDDFDNDEWGKWGDEDADNNDNKEQEYGDVQLKLELHDRVDNLFKVLHKVSGIKRSIPLREAGFGYESNFHGDSYASKGLLYKLLTRVLGKNDVPGLEYHSSTVGRLFKSGFGRLGLGQAKPSLADQNVLLIFVMGGINGLEVCEALEALSECGRPDLELILGGTTLLTPADMFDLLLGDSSYL
ncbi:Sec1 family domain-containing protein MIP3 [Melia azedarach]|uniref:Sec1 family domain-containing protein MIP3 n=1 Tax=Melia azedarach TaxID=155640 RepID=A0ACC1Z1P3_MELAZ|nr:Sec1 family domain-containing protein MIP3 [Melia azedarach]